MPGTWGQALNNGLYSRVWEFRVSLDLQSFCRDYEFRLLKFRVEDSGELGGGFGCKRSGEDKISSLAAAS